jgi:uncharacterized protein YdeI (YjbR/CyaY-like superfamily)
VRRPTREQVMVFRDAAAFRAWLEEHHDDRTEAWVGYYRKSVPKACMRYPEAVDEALCFGWIDGIGYGVDDEVYTNRFTPRRKRSTWSAANIHRVGELRAEGRMHAAGIAAFEARTRENSGIYSYERRPADLPAEHLAVLRANDAAWAWWKAQTPSYRRTATWWVVSAKQETTRQRRLATLVADCAAGRMIKPMTYGRQQLERT